MSSIKPPPMTSERWESLASYGNDFTCYSAAIATWVAIADEGWGRLVNSGMWLTISDAGDGLFGFGHFRPELRSELALVRTGADEPATAIDGVLDEVARSGRVLIAGDGFNLPWHVAAGRAHLPHWYVLSEGPDGLEVADPFACRNELGVQQATRQPVSRESLNDLLQALPGDDPVHRLREILALGDEAADGARHRHQWFVHAEVENWRRPSGAEGPTAVRRLARHFDEHGQEPRAYAQADDIWSVARHRAFLYRYAQERAVAGHDDALASWAGEHAAPLAKKWGHMAPLLMQATLALRAGRAASSSVPDTLAALAELERAASLASAENSFTI